eukprot:361596_1
MATLDLGGAKPKADTSAPIKSDLPPPTYKTEVEEEEEVRAGWSGRIVFWLAAVGSAVGLGNLWRFPAQCAKYGGGAFIFAYFVALFSLGMPLLTQELALGQKHRSGDIEAFGRMNWRLRGIGLASVFGVFCIVTYYMMIIGISIVFFFESFMVPLPYAEGNDIHTGSGYLYSDVLLLADSFESSQSVISGKLYLATCFAWVITFLCIMKGVKSASWAVRITMPLPFVLLVILLVKGLTLEGAWRGIKAYWDFSNWDDLSDSTIWNAAVGQCFFSLSICMGVMTAYGSYNPKRQDIATDEKVIAFLDVFASLMSGFVVYSILGYIVYRTGKEENFEEGGMALVFAVFPVAIAEFEGANFFAIIFYLTLVLLGIDSAFSMVEAISTVIADSDMNLYRLKWSRPKISAVICVAGAFCSSLFCFDTGLFWLDMVDRYINNYGMVFIGICESGATGWFYKYRIIESKIGKKSANLYRISYWFGLIMACFLGFALATPVETPDGDGGYYYAFTGTMGHDSWIVGFVTGIVIWCVGTVFAYFNRSDYARRHLSFAQTMWFIMGWENVEALRDFINQNGLGDVAWQNAKHTLRGEMYAGVHHSAIGIWWGFLIKYWLPTVLMVVLVGTMRHDRWNPYEGYPWTYQVVGILIFSVIVICVATVALFPQWMTQTVDKTGTYDNLDEDQQITQTGSVTPKNEEEKQGLIKEKEKEEVELVEANKEEEANVVAVQEEEEEEEEEPPKVKDFHD